MVSDIVTTNHPLYPYFLVVTCISDLHPTPPPHPSIKSWLTVTALYDRSAVCTISDQITIVPLPCSHHTTQAGIINSTQAGDC